MNKNKNLLGGAKWEVYTRFRLNVNLIINMNKKS